MLTNRAIRHRDGGLRTTDPCRKSLECRNRARGTTPVRVSSARGEKRHRYFWHVPFSDPSDLAGDARTRNTRGVGFRLGFVGERRGSDRAIRVKIMSTRPRKRRYIVFLTNALASRRKASNRIVQKTSKNRREIKKKRAIDILTPR